MRIKRHVRRLAANNNADNKGKIIFLNVLTHIFFILTRFLKIKQKMSASFLKASIEVFI
jgi:hypothetical protein